MTNIAGCFVLPEEVRILKALEDVMDPSDTIAVQLHDWLQSEINNWLTLALAGTNEFELMEYAEVNMFNIIDEINNIYLCPLSAYKNL